MIDLTKLDQVKGLQSNMRQVFDNPPGKEVMRFLEQLCGWYEFSETEKDVVQTLNGRRQVLATIKTLLEHSADQVQAVAKSVGN